MRDEPIRRERVRPSAVRISGAVAAACVAAAMALAIYAQPVRDESRAPFILPAAAIYSSEVHDSWNRLFAILFSRRFQAYLSSEIPEGAPFEDPSPNHDFRLSSRLFERKEVGDRGIDPLYFPAYHTREGRRQLLLDPVYGELKAALDDALADNSPRTALARAWMQNDLWGAYDVLAQPIFPEDRTPEMDARHAAALDELARLIRKIALTPEEIAALPDNYEQARTKLGLPDLFGGKDGWVEIEWFPDRQHDENAEYRRYSRIFLKPVRNGEKPQKLLDALRKPEADDTALLDGAAIVMQLILIDAHGKMRPTRLASEVELRNFEKTSDGKFKHTRIQVAEISRRAALREPAAGGLVGEDENSQAYLGNYAFASPTHPHGPTGEIGAPIVVKLRSRCTFCHGADATGISTFNIIEPPHFVAPAVKQVNPAGFDAAEYDIARKGKWSGWMRGYF